MNIILKDCSIRFRFKTSNIPDKVNATCSQDRLLTNTIYTDQVANKSPECEQPMYGPYSVVYMSTE